MKRKASEVKTLAKIEELDSDVDDPLLDTLRANEDMSQEEILKLIKEEETRKKATELAERGKSTVLGNEPLDEISSEKQFHSEPEKIQPEPVPYKRPVAFDDKQVTKLLKDSAQKNILPISKVDKLLEGKRRKLRKKKVVRKVCTKGPKLSESSSDSDVPEKKRKLDSSADDSQDDLRTDSVTVSKYFPNDLPKDQKSMEKITPEKSSESSDDDFEEVQIENKLGSSSHDESMDIPATKESVKIYDKEKVEPKETVSIELNFQKPPSDEEDIFADVFEPVIEPNKIKDIAKTTTGKKSGVIQLDLNLEKSDSDEDIFAEVFEVYEKGSKKLDGDIKNIETNLKVDRLLINNDMLQKSENENVNVDALKKSVQDDNKPNIKIEVSRKSEIFIDSKEAERAVIFEELLITKKKLEDEIKSSDVKESEVEEEQPNYRKFNSSDDDESFQDVEEEDRSNETQELLEKKKYFSDDKLALESTNNPEKSPRSFAKKLATVEQVRQFQVLFLHSFDFIYGVAILVGFNNN